MRVMGVSYTKKPGQKRCGAGFKKAADGATCHSNPKSRAHKVKSGEIQYSSGGAKCKPGYRKAAKKGPKRTKQAPKAHCWQSAGRVAVAQASSMCRSSSTSAPSTGTVELRTAQEEVNQVRNLIGSCA